MYGCDCHIGCLSGSVTRIGQELSGSVSRIGAELCGSVARIGQELSGSVSRIGAELCGSVARIGQELSGSVTLVCSVNKDAYLRVVPDVVWLTPDMIGGEFDIYSNVVWRIDVKDVEPEVPTILLYLTNGTTITNDTLIRNEDVTRISLLKNDTLVQNKYYFNNQ